MEKSIGLRILLITSVIVTSIFGAFIFYFENHARDAAIQRLTASLTETAKVTASSISNWMMIRSRLAHSLAEDVSALQTITDHDAIIKVLATPPHLDVFMQTFIGTERTDLLSVPPNNLPPSYDPRVREWYMFSKAADAPTISRPYIDLITGKMVISVVAPVRNHGQYVGTAGGDIELSEIIQLIKSIDLGGLGYAFLVDENGTVVIHPDPKYTLQPLDKVFPEHTPNLRQAAPDFSRSSGPEIYAFFSIPDLPSTKWKLGIVVDRQKAFAPIMDFRKTALLTAFCTIVTIIALIGLYIRQRISLPLNQMTDAMTQLSEGDLSVGIPRTQNRDEIGAMSNAMQIFKTNALEMETMREEKLRAEMEAEERKRQALEKAAQRFENTIINIVELLSAASSSLNSAAVDMSVIADRSAGLASTGAQATSEASNHVATIATATEELATSICEINRQSEKAVGLANATLQTIEDCHPNTDEQIKALNRIKDQVMRLREANGILTSAVTEQSSATEEISRSVQQASQKADEAARNIWGVKHIAKETDTSALNISSAAADLAMQTDLLQIAADDFLQEIRND